MTDEEIDAIAEEWEMGVFGKTALYQEFLRDFARAVLAAERERCAKLCDKEAEGFGGVATGPMATEYGKLVHEAMAAGAMNCAAAIRNST